MNAYGVKAGWIIPVVDKRVGGLTRAIPESALEVVTTMRYTNRRLLYFTYYTPYYIHSGLYFTYYTLTHPGEYAVGYTDGRTDVRKTVTLRFPLDAATVEV